MWKRVLAALTIAITAFLPMTETVRAGYAAVLDCHQNSGNGYWTIQLPQASPDDPPYWYEFLFLQEGGSFSTGEFQSAPNLYWGDSETAGWWNLTTGLAGRFPDGFTEVFDFQSNSGKLTVWERQWSYVDGQWVQIYQTFLGVCQIYQFVPTPIYPGGYPFWPSTSSTQFIW